MKLSINMKTTSINDLLNMGIDWVIICDIVREYADMRKQQEEKRMVEESAIYQEQHEQYHQQNHQ